MVEAWTQALVRFSDEQVQAAGQMAIEECVRFPTPVDVITRIPKEPDELKGDEKYQMAKGMCEECGKQGLCIREPPNLIWLCRNCYSGLSDDEIKSRFADLSRMMEDKAYLPEWVKLNDLPF